MSWIFGVIAPLLGSKWGLRLSAFALAAAGLLFAVAKIFLAGKASARAQENRRALKAVKSRMEVDDEIARMSPADRRNRLREWAAEE